MFTPQNRSRLTTLSKIALGLFWLALFIGTHIPGDTKFLPSNGGDKIAHFSAYLVLAFLLAAAWQLAGGVLTLRHFVFAWLAVIVYGALDEISQIPVGRDCEFMDWVADSAGAAIGLLLFAVGLRLFTRSQVNADERT